MANFLIAGSLVDTDAERETMEDVTPSQLRSYINGLDEGEPLTLDITSYGGSVTAGLAMLGLLRQAAQNGHHTTAHVIGIAASMASAIACGCQDLQIDSNAFVMVHLPWTSATGNAVDLRKEADTLDLYRDSLVAVYRTKFDLPDSVIVKMLEDETWFLGSQAPDYKLDAEIIPVAEPFRVAASLKGRKPQFAHAPKQIKDLFMEANEIKEEPITAPETIIVEKETVTETVERKTETETVTKLPEEKPEEEKPEEETPPEDPTPEPVEEPVEESVETITKAEADKRVQGMQSVMAKKLDALRKEYDGKIKDFESQLKAKDEELTKANARITSLSNDLETERNATKELTEKSSALASALEEKNKALTTLCGATLTPPESSPTDWRKLKGKAFFDFLKSKGIH